MVTQEGTRPLLIEIQALVDNTNSGYPKRHTIGLESNRILMILAVLNKYLSIPLHEYDVFVNAVGGVKILNLHLIYQFFLLYIHLLK